MEKIRSENELYAHCASLTLDDIDDNIQFDREVEFIKIDYPKCEVVKIQPINDLIGLISEFIMYFQTWEMDESYQRCHWVNDYYIEGGILRCNCAIIAIDSSERLLYYVNPGCYNSIQDFLYPYV